MDPQVIAHQQGIVSGVGMSGVRAMGMMTNTKHKTLHQT